jgi:serine/threonine protein kinase
VHPASGSEFALKEFRVRHLRLVQQPYFLREIEVMARAFHPAFVHLCGYSLPSSPNGHATILMEYMPRGCLSDILQQAASGTPPLDWDITRQLCVIFGTAGGMRYLHQRKVIQRDLKPDNILLTDRLEPRIADFGLAKLTLSEDATALQMTGKLGTPLYMAPELFAERAYDSKVDVYPFGILTYEVLSGESPFSDVTKLAVLERRVMSGERPQIPERIPACWARLVERC